MGKLKCSIPLRHRTKRLRRSPRLHRKILLHFALKSIQIRLQDFRLLVVIQRSQPESPPRSSLLQRDLACGFRVAHPLRPPTWGYQVTLPVQFQQVNRGRVSPSAFPPANFKQVVIGEHKPQPNQGSVDTIEYPLQTAWGMKPSFWQTHDFIGLPDPGYAARLSP